MLKDYHRTWAEISLDAIAHNVRMARAKMPKGSCKEPMLMCVIKADGYGHGALPLARFLEDKCEYYAVAVLEEALTLRVAGVTKPILILGYTSPSQYDAVVRAGLSQTIWSLEMAEALSKAASANAKRGGARNLPAADFSQAALAAPPQVVHVKVDTGMGRIGFADDAASVEQIAEIAKLPGIALEGIFTHFAQADEADPAGTQAQYARFDAFLAKLAAAGVSIPLKHASNSAALMAFGERYDMARLGIAMYGLYPSGEVSRGIPLQPAMTWKTHVVHLKTVPPGTGISYGHTFITARETRIATLPIGYADGYPRALSNCGRVIVRGQYAPILGRVCMDQCMVDVTDIPGVAMEDEVILLGEAGACRVTMEEIGAMSASFNYETACRVGQRVPRVYLHRGEVVDFHSALVTV